MDCVEWMILRLWNFASSWHFYEKKSLCQSHELFFVVFSEVPEPGKAPLLHCRFAIRSFPHTLMILFLIISRQYVCFFSIFCRIISWVKKNRGGGGGGGWWHSVREGWGDPRVGEPTMLWTVYDQEVSEEIQKFLFCLILIVRDIDKSYSIVTYKCKCPTIYMNLEPIYGLYNMWRRPVSQLKYTRGSDYGHGWCLTNSSFQRKACLKRHL